MKKFVKYGQKARYIILFAVLIAIVAIIIFQLSKQDKSLDNTAVNQKIVQVKSFSVSSDSTDLKTSAKGTVFVRGDEGVAEHIQIVAQIEVDPDDWGGVAFYVPDKWYISNILSSYPENGTQSKPADDVSVWMTADFSESGRAFIEVGRDRSYKPTGGGTGTIVIDIVPDKHAHQPEIFHIGVEVGSADRGSYKAMGTDHIKIPISLTDKMAT